MTHVRKVLTAVEFPWRATNFILATCQLFIARFEAQRRLADELTALRAERRVLLEREQAARASAEAANRLKDQFLATVSHELRTPMNAILGWADMLRLGTLPESHRDRACEAIFNNATRQARLIEELLDMARLRAGMLQLEKSEVDPREIATGALEIVQMAAERKRLQLSFELDGRLGMLHVDGPRLQQVMCNLLSNAVKFTPEGGQVTMRLTRIGDWAEFVVSDNGIGIPREFLGSVFEPFRQADGSVTREHDGLGLGLAIAHQVVVAHSGTITVDSAGQGRGSTFIVRLPVCGLTRVSGLTRDGIQRRTVVEIVPSDVGPDMTVARIM